MGQENPLASGMEEGSNCTFVEENALAVMGPPWRIDAPSGGVTYAGEPGGWLESSAPHRRGPGIARPRPMSVFLHTQLWDDHINENKTAREVKMMTQA